MNQAERFAEMDSMAEFAARNPARVGVHATSPKALAFRPQLLVHWEDKTLCEHLDAADRIEASEEAARRHLGDKHIAEAVEMVKDNIQSQIDAGTVDAQLGEKLMAIFERIEDVALECSWADLAGAK